MRTNMNRVIPTKYESPEISIIDVDPICLLSASENIINEFDFEELS